MVRLNLLSEGPKGLRAFCGFTLECLSLLLPIAVLFRMWRIGWRSLLFEKSLAWQFHLMIYEKPFKQILLFDLAL